MGLRDYQEEAFDLIKKKLVVKNNFLFQIPCGGGKTYIFSHVAKWLYELNRNILILSDRIELINQTTAAVQNCISSPVGVVCNSEKNITNKITIASRQSIWPLLQKRTDIKYNIVIIDEVHLFNQKHGQYFNILDELKKRHPALRVLGCTATPYRKSGVIYGPDKFFTDLDYTLPAKTLISKGLLVPFRWKVRESDIAKISKDSEQFSDIIKPVFLDSVYDVWKTHCRNRKTVIFALNITHAMAIGCIFKKHGVKVWVIHSDLSTDDIKTQINKFKSGPGIIINVGILTIGSDIPSITAIILARRIMSPALFFQIIGRGSRPSHGKKDCLICDMGGNIFIHGKDPDNPMLSPLKNADDKKERLCPQCEETLDYNCYKCPICGFIFPKEEQEEKKDVSETESGADLIEFDGKRCIPVDRILYRKHIKSGKPLPTVKITFKAGDNSYNKWICPEHRGVAKRVADKYWQEMWGTEPCPASVSEFLERSGELSKKCQITVDITKKYPEILEIKNNLF